MPSLPHEATHPTPHTPHPTPPSHETPLTCALASLRALGYDIPTDAELDADLDADLDDALDDDELDALDDAELDRYAADLTDAEIAGIIAIADQHLAARRPTNPTDPIAPPHDTS